MTKTPNFEGFEMEEKKKRTSKRQVPAAIYLGVKEERDDRLSKLDVIAKRFGLNRSQLIRDIADGKLKVVANE
jgi:hypothetical protein